MVRNRWSTSTGLGGRHHRNTHLHALLFLEDLDALLRHPKLGASWEGFVIDQLLGHLAIEWREAHFWATHSGVELDLLWVRGRRRWGFEIKRTSAPSLTRSMRTAFETLGLEKLWVVHAGAETFRLHKKVTAVAASRLLDDLG